MNESTHISEAMMGGAIASALAPNSTRSIITNKLQFIDLDLINWVDDEDITKGE